MRIAMISSECEPYAKTGGLADVAGSLPAALMHAGVDARVLVPGYKQVMEGVKSKGRLAAFPALGDMPASQILAGKLPSGVPLMIVDCPRLYDRPGGPYQDSSGADWPDNAVRFGLLSYVGAVLSGAASPISWRPRLIHCNDWQTGLAPAYLHFMPGDKARSLMTIHNLAYQGVFPPTTGSRLGLPPSSFAPDGVEYYGNMSFLKAGLYYADHITTVSPNYAQEIQTPEFGYGLDGLLRHRAAALRGILNGIDPREWNPARDAHIAQPYSAGRLAGKAAGKAALQADAGLPAAPGVLLAGVVSRLVTQKGLDLLLEALPALLELPLQLALIGTGEPRFEQALQELARQHPDRLAVRIGYDEVHAHRLIAGADLFLMPSRFEPCGLTQLYSLRYGTVPLVHRVGGLADTVVDADDAALADGRATGIVFDAPNSATLLHAVTRALGLYRNKRRWRQMMQTGMKQDFSWQHSAADYQRLYDELVPPAGAQATVTPGSR